jgi:deazaflavin-dependent oxidoreductase (nitroreductase family)
MRAMVGAVTQTIVPEQSKPLLPQGVAMSANDHPNNAPGVPMRFPPVVERLQIKYMNPMMRRVARFLPSFAVIKHRGRTSGKDYETVVNAYRKGNVLAVMLAHGKTNWVKNVLAAGEADVHLFRKDVHITNPRIVPAGTDDPTLPAIARRAARSVGVFVADIA